MKLHLVSFNVPAPPNYGGVIDVFYKLKALHAQGVDIILHCYEYGRAHAPELEAYCSEVHYYSRRLSIWNQLNLRPFIVHSRRSDALLERLLADEMPILLEGLHTCYYLAHPSLRGRCQIVRMHNIEWQYYQYLAHQEPNWLKRLFFHLELHRLKRYQRVLRHATHVLSISPRDTIQLQRQHPSVTYIPPFHPNDEVRTQVGQGDYILFHADLSVKDNEDSAIYLIEHVFGDGAIKMPFVVAGLHPTPRLERLIAARPNVHLRPNLPHHDLQQLIHNAHINLLISFQSAGMKLKLLNALFTGRFCVVNAPMVRDTGLEALCHIHDDPRSIRQALATLTLMPFTRAHLDRRKALLGTEFFNTHNAQQIRRLLSHPK